jgi:hypothetical protein
MKKSKKANLGINKFDGKKLNNLEKIIGGNADLIITIEDDLGGGGCHTECECNK